LTSFHALRHAAAAAPMPLPLRFHALGLSAPPAARQLFRQLSLILIAAAPHAAPMFMRFAARTLATWRLSADVRATLPLIAAGRLFGQTPCTFRQCDALHAYFAPIFMISHFRRRATIFSHFAFD